MLEKAAEQLMSCFRVCASDKSVHKITHDIHTWYTHTIYIRYTHDIHTIQILDCVHTEFTFFRGLFIVFHCLRKLKLPLQITVNRSKILHKVIKSKNLPMETLWPFRLNCMFDFILNILYISWSTFLVVVFIFAVEPGSTTLRSGGWCFWATSSSRSISRCRRDLETQVQTCSCYNNIYYIIKVLLFERAVI